MMNIAAFLAPSVLETYAVNDKGEFTTLNGVSVHVNSHIINNVCFKATDIVTTWTATSDAFKAVIDTLLKILDISREDLNVVTMGKRTLCHEILAADVNHPTVIQSDMAPTLLTELQEMREKIAAARADLFVDNPERTAEEIQDMYEYRRQANALHFVERMTTALMNIHDRTDRSFVVIGL